MHAAALRGALATPSPARAEVLAHGTHPDKVQVTVVGADGLAGSYRRRQLLTS
ncbi:hypothetical protein [Streptomyces kronopolitis]|uniref:hypothetical protein n=1 Tax=Streptomyces kronopolitis TaxID=1612435 RepID=UPI003D98C58C